MDKIKIISATFRLCFLEMIFNIYFPINHI